MQDNNDIPSLISALDDNDFYIRCLAASSLGELKATSATAKLCKMLEEECNFNLIVAVIDALKQIGNESAIDALKKFTVRTGSNISLKALSKIPNADLDSFFLDLYRNQNLCSNDSEIILKRFIEISPNQAIPILKDFLLKGKIDEVDTVIKNSEFKLNSQDKKELVDLLIELINQKYSMRKS